MKKRQRSHASLLKQGKKLFNLYIRLRDAIPGSGRVKCVTCGRFVHYKNSDAGHYIHGFDFVESNQHAQCKRCNMYLHGNLAEYHDFMLRKYGRDEINLLKRMSRERQHYHSFELEEKIRDLKEKIRILKKSKGIS